MSAGLGGLIRAGLVAALVGVLLAPAPVGQAGGRGLATGDRAVTVTLLTGDRVTVNPHAGFTVGTITPGAGREAVPFTTERQGRKVYVVPGDALAMISNGTLDRRLFDVALLAELGYDDASRADLPLIVQPGGTGVSVLPDGAAGAGGAAGVSIRAALPVIAGAAVAVAKPAIAGFWRELAADPSPQSPQRKVWLDGRRTVALDVSVPMSGAIEAWQAGYTGAGVTVAVLDTGLDATHPDLAGRIVESRNFTDAPNTDDTVGHGTHVASTIVGSGGTYRGIAPDAGLLVGKVCPDRSCPESAIIAGAQWAAERGADVVNLSLGGEDAPGLDPLEQAVTELTASHGTLFVIAAGNDGDLGASTVASPASADAALAVGAVDKQRRMYYASGQGPRRGDGALKPDIVAPGVGIVAARAANGQVGEPGQPYVSMTGTSMATPHVAGAAAIMVQRRPEWTPAQLKSALLGAADPLPATGAFRQGAGLLDVGEAIAQPVVTAPASLSLGVQPWPHDDDEPVTRTLTYHNADAEPITYALSLQTVGPDGAPAPAGVFTLDRTLVTVPAGGQASVDLSADTTVPGPDGHYTGWVVATAPAGTVSTPFGIDRAIEAYDLALEVLGRDGTRTADYQLTIGRYDDEYWQISPYDADGELTVRLPAGAYYLIARIIGDDPVTGRPATSLLVWPGLTADGDHTATLDARTAGPIDVTVPERSARLVQGMVAATVVTDSVEFGRSRQSWAANSLGGWSAIYTAQLGDAVDPQRFQSSVSGVWAREGEGGSFDASPYAYHFGWFDYGTMPTGLVRRLDPKDFARVETTYVAPDDRGGSFAWVGSLGHSHDGLVSIPGEPFLNMGLPGRRVEYFNTENIEWYSLMLQVRPADGGGYIVEAEQYSEPTRYRGGVRYEQRWNGAVLGPGFTRRTFTSDPWVGRQRDTLIASMPMFSDSDPGHAGISAYDSGFTQLRVNGELVAESEEPGFIYAEGLPDEAGTYQLTTGATRSVANVSTEVSATWTVTSGRPPGDGLTALPVMAVRFAPALDDRNRARPGTFGIPLTVQWQPGAPATPLRSLAVDVSYDDGATWLPATVEASGDGWTARVQHPRTAAFVSLRASATDAGGNSVQQTIIRAYRLA